MSLAKDLCRGTVDTMVGRTGLVETRSDAGPFQLLTSPMSPEPVSDPPPLVWPVI